MAVHASAASTSFSVDYQGSYAWHENFQGAGAARSFCLALHRNTLAYAAAVRYATEIADAYATTVDRLSWAASHHRGTGVALQGRTADGLARSLRGASSRERALGARLAALIRSAHVAGRLSDAQSATGIADVVRRLAKRGVARTHLPASGLVPQAVDLLAALAR